MEENLLIDNDNLVSVKNRSNSIIGYTIPELRVERHFAKNETKKIKMEELRQLSYQPGGDVLLRDYLIIEAPAAVKELIPGVEIEYNYDEKKIKEILSTGSKDLLLDTLDFGPDGVKELIKDIAVEIKLNDVEKRDIIKEKTGFDVSKAIEINRINEEEVNQSSETKQRRVTNSEENNGQVPIRRRVVTK